MDSDEPKKPDVGEPAGQQLKRAREKHGLSQKDVADAQHLRVSIIQAIEDGNYEDIASELFLKGYVRAYATQVGADADALIASLDIELKPLREERAKQERENPLIYIERRRRKKRQVAKALFVILVLGGAMFAAWKLVVEPRLPSEAASPGIEAPEESSAEAPVGDEDNGAMQPEPQLDSEREESAGLQPQEDELTVSEPALESAREPAREPDQNLEAVASETTDIADNSPESASDSPDAATDSETAVAQEPMASTSQQIAATEAPQEESSEVESVSTEPVAEPDPVFEESAQPEAVSAQARLEMSFVADCWVQVTDSSGARLVASLQRAGEQVSVTGRAPIKVIIGAVDAVETVSFDGETISLTDYRVVNNRTEFTLSL